MTQLGSNQDYSVIHCQVMDDMQTLKVDQGNGFLAARFFKQNRNKAIGMPKKTKKGKPELGGQQHMCLLMICEYT